MGIVVFAILFGLDYIATVPPTVMLVAEPVRTAQRRRRLRLGVRGAPGRRGGRGASRAGVVRERVGDYAAAFYAAGWIAIVAGFAALAIRRRPPTSERTPSPVAGSAA